MNIIISSSIAQCLSIAFYREFKRVMYSTNFVYMIIETYKKILYFSKANRIINLNLNLLQISHLINMAK